MSTIVLAREGETTMGVENKFVGWADVDLSEQGKIEALLAGKKIKQLDINLDIVFTSVLKQSIKSLWLIQEGLGCLSLDTLHDWRLNGRHMGSMQGLIISDLSQTYGQERLQNWLNSFEEKAPQLSSDEAEYIRFIHDFRYSHIDLQVLPLGESRMDVAKRVLMFWSERIRQGLKENMNILIVADEIVLKSIIMFLDKISPLNMGDVTIKVESPVIYEIDGDEVVRRKYSI